MVQIRAGHTRRSPAVVIRADPPPGNRAAPRRKRTENQASRLSGAGAFEAMFRHGSRREGRYVQIVYAPIPSGRPAGSGRAGFVIGRKALPRAVDRNRLKRMLRESLRALRPEVRAFDVVLRLRNPVATTLLPEVAREADALVRDVVVVRSPALGPR